MRAEQGYTFGFSSLWIGVGNAVIGAAIAWIVLARRTKNMTVHLCTKTMPEFFEARYHVKDHDHDAHEHDDALDKIRNGGGEISPEKEVDRRQKRHDQHHPDKVDAEHAFKEVAEPRKLGAAADRA